MSLNGLDDVKIREAYEAAAAEPGGWFLLKYSSRDEVELLGRGNGGIVEVRNAIAQYEETSPLFGFLRYRRRNVIIKFVPEDCSRLVQARVTVHFIAVTEQFSPHDTVFSITSPKELKDSTLSAACSLHTASGSTSSSTSSLRRRRLMEIVEDAEEDMRSKRQSTVPEERPSTARSPESPSALLTAPRPYSPEQTRRDHRSPPVSYQPNLNDRSTSPPPPREPFKPHIRPSSPTRSIDDRRTSTHSTRPDLHTYSSYGSNSKPKIKLGPRPSLDVSGRPHSSASSSLFRPVSSLPAGLKVTSRSPKKTTEFTTSRPSSVAPNLTITPPPVPETPAQMTTLRPQTSGGRPTTSSGASFHPPLSPSALSSKVPFMTPEKARLMKALELRKKREQQALTTEPIAPIIQEIPEIQSVEYKSQISPEPASHDTHSTENGIEKIDDSGIAFESIPAPKTDDSDATRSDSYPVSPACASENAESTRASSISESTDETIQDKIAPSEVPPTNVAQESKRISGGKDQHHPTTTEVDSGLQYLLPVTYSPYTPSATLSDVSISVNKSVEDEVHEESTTTTSGQIPNVKSMLSDSDARLPPVSEDISSQHLVSESGQQKVGNLEVQQPKIAGDEMSLSLNHKRRGIIDPIRTDIDFQDRRNSTSSNVNLSSDDDFMDELQSAVVQEAMPMSVSKSPLTPVIPSPQKKVNGFSRTFSSPPRKEYLSSSQPELPSILKSGTSRSVSASAAYMSRIKQQAERPVAKKVNLGSGISQRIKALEKLSSNGPAAGSPVLTAPSTSPAFFSVQKLGNRPSSRSPSIAERASTLARTPSPSNSRESSPCTVKARDRSGSIQSRVDAFRVAPSSAGKPQKMRPETISVTARIVRDPAQPLLSTSEAGRTPLESKFIDFKQSLLEIDHHGPVGGSRSETLQQRRRSKGTPSPSAEKNERRSSITIIRDFVSEGRSSFSERRRSMNLEPSSAKSPSRPPSTHTTQRPMSISSRLSISSRDLSFGSPPDTAGSSSSNSDDKAEKKSNRASRMLRRMSSSLSSGRKAVSHAMSPTVREEFEPPNLATSHTPLSSRASTAPAPTSLSIGDVNVQFPDSLLWKRRSMAIDSNGYLILLPALTASGSGKDKGAVATRKFHFSGFRIPTIPDVEMQELPNSVVLDFVDGSGLQVACEDRAGQGRVLQALQDAHRTWAAYGQ